MRVWRVRWWVRLLAAAVPLLAAPFVFYRPLMPNPDWQRDGMPASEWPWVAGIYVVLGLAVLAAFRSRVELGDGRVRVVNPVRSHVFAVSDVVEVRAGSGGVEFALSSGRVVSAFAVQSTAIHTGAEPRWMEIARAVRQG